MVKVIGLCLWGNVPKYTYGLIENLKLAQKYYPDWECWVYIHVPSVNPDIILQASEYTNTKIFLMTDKDIRSCRFMLWRLEPIDNPDVEYVMCRDIDSRITIKEVLAVQEWLDSGKTLHIMRDHPNHYPKILGGMFGVKSGPVVNNVTWKSRIEKFYNMNQGDTDDQIFLMELYLHVPQQERIIHDEIKLYEGTECKPYPIKYSRDGQFIGEYIYADESTDTPTRNILINWINTTAPQDRVAEIDISIDRQLEYISSMIQNIYVMHYSKLTDRKVNLQRQLSNLFLDKHIRINWIENFDREDITQEMISTGYSFNPNVLPRHLTMPEIANGLAHVHILETIGEKDETGLVLEDDTIFKPNFISHLYTALKNLPDDWDSVCLGGPVEDSVYPVKSLPNVCIKDFPSCDIQLYKPSSPSVCTLSCILFRKCGIDKLFRIVNILKPFSTPIDDAIWIATIATGNFNMYWCQPWISYEGSKTPQFNTSLERGF